MCLQEEFINLRSDSASFTSCKKKTQPNIFGVFLFFFFNNASMCKVTILEILY